MAKARTTASAPWNGNRLLSRLPKETSKRLHERMKRLRLDRHDVVYEEQGPIKYAYFPIDCMLSAVTVMEDGSAIEVATIGKEGAVGLPTFLDADTSPNRVFAQVAGDALRLPALELKQEAERDAALRDLLARYAVTFIAQISQSVACNGLHPLEMRCCRWLLISHDRASSDHLPLTHEFLAIMLGVRRASVGEVLQGLKNDGLIRYSRGTITVLNRTGLEAKSCECNRTVADAYQRLLG